jgi:5'-deoxynucleotidase YfbR-like HD superfamily hydrolase
MTPYYAAMTRRWHTNEHLSHTVDPVGYHGGRMAILALMFWPDCGKELIADCVTHDLGEYTTGDIPWGSPNKDHDAEERARDKMCMYYATRDPRLKFLDSLDAYLWAQHHAPHVLSRADWQEQRNKLLAQAVELGVDFKSHDIDLWRC